MRILEERHVLEKQLPKMWMNAYTKSGISGKKRKPTMQSAMRPGNTGPSTQREW